MKFSNRPTGFNEFDKLLKELPKRVENKVLQAAVTGALRDERKNFVAAAPRAEEGQSAASKTYGRGYKNIKIVRIRRLKKGMRGARITTGNAFWLLIYEIGSRFQPARPWFLPTFRAAVERIIGSLGKRIGEGIKREALKGKL